MYNQSPSIALKLFFHFRHRLNGFYLASLQGGRFQLLPAEALAAQLEYHSISAQSKVAFSLKFSRHSAEFLLQVKIMLKLPSFRNPLCHAKNLSRNSEALMMQVFMPCWQQA